MNHDLPRENLDQDQEDLVAYLDNELDEQRRQSVERRLAEDDQYRSQLHELQKCWDLLDTLPRPTADEQFTHATVEMVVVTAENDLISARKHDRWRQLNGWITCIVTVVAFASIGYFLMTAFLSRSQQQLLADLPLISQLDSYRYADNIEFLQAMYDEQLFAANSEPTAVQQNGFPVFSDSPLNRAQQLDSLTARQTQALQQLSERFNALPPTKQDDLRQVHDDVSNHPAPAELASVMHAYTTWLKSLTSLERAELLELAAEDRVRKIRQIIRNQQNRRWDELNNMRLTQEDRRAIMRWMERHVEAHWDEIESRLPREVQRRLNGPGQLMRRNMMLMALRARRSGIRLPPPSDEEINTLLESLSPAARKRLNQAESAEAKLIRVEQWLRAVAYSRMMPEINAEDLRQFFATELSAEQREYLESLSRDRMLTELRQLYMQHHLRRPHGGRGPGYGPGPGGFWRRRGPAPPES